MAKFLFQKGHKGYFPKDYTPWNKGKKMSIEYREKLSKAHKGKPLPKGSLENLIKMAEKRKGVKRPPRSEEWKKNMSKAQKGKVLGKKAWNWKGGIEHENHKIRHSFEYRLWRKSVFERDNYQCIWGGKEHGSKLNADHIKPFALYPELRFAIDNGRTLCVECHRKTDTWGGSSRGKRK